MLTIQTPSRASREMLRGFQYTSAAKLRGESWIDYDDRRQDMALAMLIHGDSPIAEPLAEHTQPSRSMLDRCKATIKAHYGKVGAGQHRDAELNRETARLGDLLNGKVSIDLATIGEEYSSLFLTALAAGRVQPSEIRIAKSKLFIKIRDKQRRKDIRQCLKRLARANWTNPVGPIGKPSLAPPSTRPYCVPCPVVQSPHSPEGFYCPIPSR